MKTTDWQERNVETSPSEGTAFPNMPPAIRSLLSNRGYSNQQEIEKLLKASLQDLRSPFLLKDMEKACVRLFQAFQKNEKVCIYADFDMDGTSGLALFLEALELLGFENFTYYQPKRLSEGYGFHASVVEDLKKQNVDLIMTIDLGITALEAVDTANALGIDVIITDHHQPKEELPRAFAIVNPNQVACESQLGHLCGAGVAFYLVMALRQHFAKQGLQVNWDVKKLLDCFVIGTLTDMVPMIEENRALAKHGLLQLVRSERPAIRLLLEKLKLTGHPLTSQDVAISFAPKLNALSRMELDILPLHIFLEKDETRAQKLADQVLEINQSRKDSQKNAEVAAAAQLPEQKSQDFLFFHNSEFHKGVIGLVATKFCLEHQVPTFAATLEEDGLWVGSGRLPEHYTGANLLDLLDYASEFLVKFGGHTHAAGFTLKNENLENLKLKLAEYFTKNATRVEAPQQRKAFFDATLELGDVDEELMAWLDRLGPFGATFPNPIFFVERAFVSDIKVMNGGHLRLDLRESEGSRFFYKGLCFSPSPRLKEVQPGKTYSMLVEPQWNYFAGRRTIQLLIRDIIGT